MRLSIALITYNEAARLPACLASVDFADEVVVVDNGSTDGTVALAQSLGARVVQTPDWPGFGVQKNRAVDLCRGDWVFSIDADEQVTPELKAQILSVIAGPSSDCVAYTVNRSSSYCGRYMRHSGWYPDRVLRLFRRGQARFSEAAVHESLQAQGPVGRLEADLLHQSFADFETVLDKVNRYSTASAAALAERGKRGSVPKAVAHGLWAFFRTYVLKRGFLDGQLGLALAVSNAEGTYYRYMKLWLKQRA
ncbi:LPS biosynthesis protein [Rhodoferax koreense]|uniref:LPS biosynthesis protein n=1 Tax=Rhodoferax koreensis TaxID=1842727 RepID=A0A1P8JW78_9BURK|nr:glycosyltransferase family 2 protein [Rhodoferax koreense]APW37988.1 LPS biosynthesis protein [Rhodoferax koreense]